MNVLGEGHVAITSPVQEPSQKKSALVVTNWERIKVILPHADTDVHCMEHIQGQRVRTCGVSYCAIRSIAQYQRSYK